ncbi:conserved protein of unknown function [Rhodovastum atsumiense]|uniref:Uncharacterized protein n=1 Tax=Rhodovastum atsumiense TaxID=504468 RepID=A0A5M6IZA9_9PROT|nr:hypothetical protein [Rhodovastum atsumiense]KAA5612688.1 hypothetical protein F1189_08085 [Rhodovastum atsumiense]CAH2602765.1 conserved protein of unknown function [Rhodovastum atsumiense]
MPADHSSLVDYGAVFRIASDLRKIIPDLGKRRGWSMLADLLTTRFTFAYEDFLDRPTEANLARLRAILDDAHRINRQFPDVRAGYQSA